MKFTNDAVTLLRDKDGGLLETYLVDAKFFLEAYNFDNASTLPPWMEAVYNNDTNRKALFDYIRYLIKTNDLIVMTLAFFYKEGNVSVRPLEALYEAGYMRVTDETRAEYFNEEPDELHQALSDIRKDLNKFISSLNKLEDVLQSRS